MANYPMKKHRTKSLRSSVNTDNDRYYRLSAKRIYDTRPFLRPLGDLSCLETHRQERKTHRGLIPQ